MGIFKKAQSMTINVTTIHNTVVGGKFEKIGKKLNVEATKENMVMASNKKIVSLGNKQQ